MSEVLASFFLHKNFNLFLIRNSSRKAWKLKGVRSSRLHRLSTNWAISKCERKEISFLFQNSTLLEVLAGCELSMIFSFFAIFSKSFWSSGWWILPADEDPAFSRVDTEELFLVFRDFPLAAEESGCGLSMMFSCRPENENNSKFAQCFAFWIAFSLLFFQNHFGVQDDGYYLRMTILLVVAEELFLDFISLFFPLVARESVFTKSVFSCGTANRSNSKFAQCFAFWIAFSLLFFSKSFRS